MSIEELKQVMNIINEKAKNTEWWIEKIENIRWDLDKENAKKIYNLIVTYYWGRKHINAKDWQEKNEKDVESKIQMYKLPAYLNKDDAEIIKEFMKNAARDAYKFFCSRIRKELRMIFFYNFWKTYFKEIQEKANHEEDREIIFHQIYEYFFANLDPQQKYIQENRAMLNVFSWFIQRQKVIYENQQATLEVLNTLESKKEPEEEPTEIIENGEIIGEPGKYHDHSRQENIVMEDGTDDGNETNTTMITENKEVEKEEEIDVQDKYHKWFDETIKMPWTVFPTETDH